MDWVNKLIDAIMPRPNDEDEDQEQDKIKKLEAPVKEAEKSKTEVVPSAAVSTTGTESATDANAAGAVTSVHATGSTSSTASMGYGSAMKFSSDPIAPPPMSMRPPLTVIDSKYNEINIKIYNPTKYEEASQIAADILSRNAAVVNYDYVEQALQIRICDFLNGVCYVTDGYTDKISEKIFVYVPEGIDTVDIAEAVASVNNNRRSVFAS